MSNCIHSHAIRLHSICYYKSPKNISRILIQYVSHRIFIYGGVRCAGMGV